MTFNPQRESPTPFPNTQINRPCYFIDCKQSLFFFFLSMVECEHSGGNEGGAWEKKAKKSFFLFLPQSLLLFTINLHNLLHWLWGKDNYLQSTKRVQSTVQGIVCGLGIICGWGSLFILRYCTVLLIFSWVITVPYKGLYGQTEKEIECGTYHIEAVFTYQIVPL